MKRKLLIIGVPLIVLVAWIYSSATAAHSDAEIDMSSAHPIALRSSVVAAVTAAGGMRTNENTSYNGQGTSQLTFKIPTARIEEATQALAGLGGTITDQRVDLSDAEDQASGVTQKVADARTCLNEVALAPASPAARQQLARCRDDLTAVAGRLGSSSVDLTSTVLIVKIAPLDQSNPALVVAIVLLLVAAIGMGVLVWRSARIRPTVDLRELAEYETEDDLHLRRN